MENCRRADLEEKTPDQLNKHYRLCAKHFEPAMICKTVMSYLNVLSYYLNSSNSEMFFFSVECVFQSPYRTVLRDTAIPTIFDLTSHLCNPHSRHRKRIKVLVEYIYIFFRCFHKYSCSTIVYSFESSFLLLILNYIIITDFLQ